MSDRCKCGITVGELTKNFSGEEGVNSGYDLALEFADDETLVVYMAHHEEAKDARQILSALVGGINELERQKLSET